MFGNAAYVDIVKKKTNVRISMPFTKVVYIEMPQSVIHYTGK